MGSGWSGVRGGSGGGAGSAGGSCSTTLNFSTRSGAIILHHHYGQCLFASLVNLRGSGTFGFISEGESFTTPTYIDLLKHPGKMLVERRRCFCPGAQGSCAKPAATSEEDFQSEAVAV